MRIDIASHKDIPELVRLLGHLFEQEHEFESDVGQQESGIRAIIDNPALGEILLIKNNSSVLGMVNLLYTISTALGGRVAILEDMIVQPDYRGTGLGSLLISKAIQHAQQRNCRRITLLTDEDNIDAHRFYIRHGFKRSDMKVFRLPLNTKEPQR